MTFAHELTHAIIFRQNPEQAKKDLINYSDTGYNKFIHEVQAHYIEFLVYEQLMANGKNLNIEISSDKTFKKYRRIHQENPDMSRSDLAKKCFKEVRLGQYSRGTSQETIEKCMNNGKLLPCFDYIWNSKQN